ncbi:M48 family metallopeptidase [Porticoccus sp. W117]|uniref:M48 family metallopeptidase n=1 Tax=Porticoccus sp. W117 TaxID=3054777 RepID=UPI002596672F|nr:M48 family metallopeptidase [Porticoccus sp. W117]MDM3870879.1 M48 family metallopeptidase [Porticoccus sp. W117]
MEYQNPQVPEGINVSKQHPLKEFAWMLATVGAITLAVVLVLSLLAGWLVKFVPFSVEQQLAQQVISQLPASEPSSRHQQTQQYLQELADKLVANAPLPDGMSITVHYVDDNIVNAAATLGGHVLMYRGLLEKLPNENALAMVMAHEIAHVRHRDPLMALGRGVVVTTALAAISGFSDSQLSSWVVGLGSNLTLLKFSRDQEHAADENGLLALHATYGHTGGSEQLFEVLAQAHGDGEAWATFLATHPLSDERIAELAKLAAENGWQQQGDLTPLPEFLAKPEQ